MTKFIIQDLETKLYLEFSDKKQTWNQSHVKAYKFKQHIDAYNEIRYLKEGNYTIIQVYNNFQ